jgi:hypothetical protein
MQMKHESAAAAEADALLAFPFLSDEFRYVLVRREGWICLVQRISLDARSGDAIDHEVIMLQIAAAAGAGIASSSPAAPVKVLEVGSQTLTILEPDQSRREIAPGCDVFAVEVCGP